MHCYFCPPSLRRFVSVRHTKYLFKKLIMKYFEIEYCGWIYISKYEPYFYFLTLVEKSQLMYPTLLPYFLSYKRILVIRLFATEYFEIEKCGWNYILCRAVVWRGWYYMFISYLEKKRTKENIDELNSLPLTCMNRVRVRSNKRSSLMYFFKCYAVWTINGVCI